MMNNNTTTNGWNTALFNYDAGHLTYGVGTYIGQSDTKFVARFKYSAQRKQKASFLKFLTANFTPAEYFGLLASGDTPVGALNRKGYDWGKK